MSDAPESDGLKTFTARKLDRLENIAADPRVKSAAFEVAFYISQRTNLRTGKAIISDEAIADETGQSRSNVIRARGELRSAGWLTWTRTQFSNVYELLDGPSGTVLDFRTMLRDQRREAREGLRRDVPPMKHPKRGDDVPPAEHLCSADVSSAIHQDLADVPPAASPEVPPVKQREVPPVEHIHLQTNTFILTPSEEQTSEEVVDDGGVERPLPAIPNPALAECRLLDLLGEGDADRGVHVAHLIGDARFKYLLHAYVEGDLWPAAVIAATQNGREIEAERNRIKPALDHNRPSSIGDLDAPGG